MTLLFPISASAKDAVSTARHAARTKADADSLAGEGLRISGLETEWLTLTEAEAEAVMADAEAGEWGAGFIQRYENASGAPVLAVTYWKQVDPSATPKAAPPDKPAEAPPEETADHTDDLYFRKGRTKKRGRRKTKVDPNQMDLFSSGEGD